MKEIDWDERRYQIILNLTKNVSISDRDAIPYREIEIMADELISYMKTKTDGYQGLDNKLSLIIEAAEKVPESICRYGGRSMANSAYRQGLTDATDEIISIIKQIRGKENGTD